MSSKRLLHLSKNLMLVHSDIFHTSMYLIRELSACPSRHIPYTNTSPSHLPQKQKVAKSFLSNSYTPYSYFGFYSRLGRKIHSRVILSCVSNLMISRLVCLTNSNLSLSPYSNKSWFFFLHQYKNKFLTNWIPMIFQIIQTQL